MTGLTAAHAPERSTVETDSPWPLAVASFVEAAAQAVDGRTATLDFAGSALTLAVVGAALTDLVFPTFAHLIVPAAFTRQQGGPAIRIWDCAATGIPPPPPRGSADWQSEGEGWRVAAYSGSRYLCEERPGSTIWLDRADASLIMAVADARNVTVSDGARPLQRMMSEYCRALGVQDVHAGLVSLDGRGVMIVGGSGRGKTTTSIDGFCGGLDFLGDDTIAIASSTGGAVTGHSIYGSARLFPEQTARWPELARRWIGPGPGEDKAVFFPGAVNPARVAVSTRIAAIAVPVVGSGRMAVSRSTPRQAFHALVRDSRDYHLRFGMQAADFSRLAGLTKSVPCYHFELDRDPARVAGGLRQMIEANAP